MQNFRKYYRLWFILAAIIVIALQAYDYFVKGSFRFQTENLYYFLFALIIGLVNHFYHLTFYERKLNNLRLRFSALQELGLAPTGKIFEGYYRKYYTVAYPQLNGSTEKLMFFIALSPNKEQDGDIDKLREEYEIVEGKDGLLHLSIPYPLPNQHFKPEVEAIKALLDKAIDRLVDFKIETIVVD